MDEEELELLAEQAAELITERHAERLRASETIRVAFSEHRGHRRVALTLADAVAETVMEFFADVTGVDDEEALHLGLDFLDGVLAEHLASDREAIPRLDPAPYEFEGHILYLCGGLRRPELESAADALLAAAAEDDDPEGH